MSTQHGLGRDPEWLTAAAKRHLALEETAQWANKGRGPQIPLAERMAANQGQGEWHPRHGRPEIPPDEYNNAALVLRCLWSLLPRERVQAPVPRTALDDALFVNRLAKPLALECRSRGYNLLTARLHEIADGAWYFFFKKFSNDPNGWLVDEPNPKRRKRNAIAWPHFRVSEGELNAICAEAASEFGVARFGTSE